MLVLWRTLDGIPRHMRDSGVHSLLPSFVVAKKSSYSLDYGRALLEELCRIPLVEFGLAALEKGARVVLHQPVGTAVVATTVALAGVEPLRAVRALGGVALGRHVGGEELFVVGGVGCCCTRDC